MPRVLAIWGKLASMPLSQIFIVTELLSWSAYGSDRWPGLLFGYGSCRR